MRLRFFSTVLAVLAAQSLHAHDFWIEPSAHRVEVGTVLDVGLRVGEDYRGDPVPRHPAGIRRFVLSGPAGEEAIPGAEGADPAGRVPIRTPGLFVLGYHSRPAPVRLEARKFEEYLAEEGLEGIIARRAERRESAKPGREIFSRCAKSLVASGGAAGFGHDRRLGLPLELIPETNPFESAGGSLSVRLLFHERPLEGALVVAVSREEPGTKLTTRSDRRGRAVLDLAAGRTWLVKAVHMVPAPAGTDADWESLWASLTFEIPKHPGGATLP
jgi:uncharacterized GH25 family protein